MKSDSYRSSAVKRSPLGSIDWPIGALASPSWNDVTPAPLYRTILSISQPIFLHFQGLPQEWLTPVALQQTISQRNENGGTEKPI